MKLRQLLLWLISMGSMLLLSGCDFVVLNPKGSIAADEKELLITAVLLMLIIVIPVIILTFVIAYRYRASNQKAKYTPDWSHSNVLEAIWWTLPIIIIVILATITWISAHKLDPYRPLDSKTKPITIQVVALDWKWLFIYPEQKIATVNFVEFPVNTPVNFVITSDAPMNSFQIPALGGQIYAMAGMTTKMHYLATEAGDYNGRSVSFSGPGFAGMTFIARVTSDDAFNAWVKTVKQSPNKLNMDAYNKLALPSENNPVMYYSSVADNLYNNIVMKFMMPMPNSAPAKTAPLGMAKPADKAPVAVKAPEKANASSKAVAPKTVKDNTAKAAATGKASVNDSSKTQAVSSVKAKSDNKPKIIQS